MSSINLKPDFWGPSFWKTIHLAIIGMPEQLDATNKQALSDFLYSFTNLLPCKSCRDHYTLNIEENPPDLTSKSSLWKWSVDIHNSVNQRTGKSELTYDEAIKANLTSNPLHNSVTQESNISTIRQDTSGAYDNCVQNKIIFMFIFALVIFLIFFYGIKQ